jgi:CsoR family transcriptional regulator, copper-sensing transcriptional repressor
MIPYPAGVWGVDRETNKKAQERLKRIAGQVAGIQRMLEADRYCVDVLLQISAVQAALMETGRVILTGHVESCLSDAIEKHDEAERRKKIDELMLVFSRFLRIDDDEPARPVRRARR